MTERKPPVDPPSDDLVEESQATNDDKVEVLSPQEVTASKTFRQIVLLADTLAVALGGPRGCDLPILVDGPSGTGKEWLAKRIAQIAGLVLVVIDCAGIQKDLAESELFGHEKGAFTGAERRKIGMLERSGKALLFFDEIGKTPLHVQKKLLRVIENRTIRRVGGTTEIKIECRMLFACSELLEDLVEKDEFYPDLFHRIKTARLTLPPLDSRRADIPRLAAMFAANLDAEITPEAIKVLKGASWTGNVRELRNNIRTAAAISDGVIEADHCRMFLSEVKPTDRDARAIALEMAVNGFTRRQFQKRTGMTEPTSRRFLTSLVDAGDLERTRRGRGYVYHLPSLL